MIRRILLVAILSITAVGAGAQSDIFVVTIDFATGSAALLPADESIAQVNLLSVHSDAVGHFQDGKIWIINRLGQDNILVLDPATPAIPVQQFSVGNGSNPHDIEILAPDKAYVSLYDRSWLLIVDPRDGTELGTIDLSSFADEDGIPEVSLVVRLGDLIYLSCSRLDRNTDWGPVDKGLLIVVDPTTDEVVDSITLAAANPNAVVAVEGGRIIISSVGDFGDRDGGISMVDVASGRDLGLAIGEQTLGGDLQSIVMVDARRGYAVVSDENFANLVRPFDLQTGDVGEPLAGLSGGFIMTIAIDGDRLIVGDRGSFSDPTSAGLKIFDTTTQQQVGGPIDTGLPAASIVVLSEPMLPTAIVEGQSPGSIPTELALDEAYPNPFNASVRIPFRVDVDSRSVQLTVFDLLGQAVQRLVSTPLAAGFYSVTWDGRSADGRAAGSGSYLLVLQADGLRTTSKITLLK